MSITQPESKSETNITRSTMIKLARKAGVKNISVQCFDSVRDILDEKLSKILESVANVSSVKKTKTIMVEDVYDAFTLNGYHLAKSTVLDARKVKIGKTKKKAVPAE